MIHREFDDFPHEELAAESLKDVVPSSRKTPAIVPPQDPRQSSGIVAYGVEKDQRSAGHAAQLREHSRPRGLREVVGDVEAQRKIEAVRREGKVRGVSDQRDGVGTPPPSGQHGSRVDVERYRVEPQASGEASARAAHVEDATRRRLRENGFQFLDHDRTPGRVLDELVKPGSGDDSRGDPLKERFGHGDPEPDCWVSDVFPRWVGFGPIADVLRRKIDPPRSDCTGR